jgi:hypothetical protein
MNDKVNEIKYKVFEVLKDYYPTEASNALSAILAAILSTYCRENGVKCEPVLRDLFADIENLTKYLIKDHENEEIKVKI